MKNKIILSVIVLLGISFLCFGQEKISLNFKDADIKVVLQTLAEKSGVNIVSTPQVEGLISVQLKEVDWNTALEVILKTYNYGYQWIGEDIVLVSTLEDLTERRAREEEAEVKEPLDTKVFFLYFSRAADVQGPLQALLTERGRITVDTRTNALIITDTQSKLRDMENTIKQLDKETHQIYIEARFVEVDEDKLRDIGFDWSTGANEGPSVLPHRTLVTVYYPTVDDDGNPITASYTDVVTADTVDIKSDHSKGVAAQFLPSEDQGLDLLFQKLTGTQFEMLLQALENDEVTNVISNPKILTLENIEARILVGDRVPIPVYAYSTETGQQVVSGYATQEAGILFRVTPKVVKDDTISLRLTPEVSEITGWTGPNNERPIISTREATTEVAIKDGETVMIGGLVKEKVIDGVSGIPFLKDIPLVGLLFQKKSVNVEKIDLVIFVTAKIVVPGQSLSGEKIASAEDVSFEAAPSEDASSEDVPEQDNASRAR
ncbi:MAG: type IV pilus secretin PilQ [Candidatus Omnitrophica bacterium]|nr:type IV pilus secretin PilQ [Candidatus Omnitrophota bacterium]